MNPLPFNNTEVACFTVVVIIALLVPLAAGVYVDTRQGSWPVWTVVGVAVGCMIGMSWVGVHVARRLKAYTIDNIDVECVEETATYPNEEEPAQCQNC